MSNKLYLVVTLHCRLFLKCNASRKGVINSHALFRSVLRPAAGASLFAASTFTLAGTAFFCVVALEAATGAFFPAVDPVNAFPTLFTIVVAVELPEALLLSLATRLSVEEAPGAAAPRLARVTAGFGAVVCLLVFRAVPAPPPVVDALAFEPFPVTIFARLVVAATAAALIGDEVFRGD